MQSLEVSGAVRPIYGSLGVKRLKTKPQLRYTCPYVLNAAKHNIQILQPIYNILQGSGLCSCTCEGSCRFMVVVGWQERVTNIYQDRDLWQAFVNTVTNTLNCLKFSEISKKTPASQDRPWLQELGRNRRKSVIWLANECIIFHIWYTLWNTMAATVSQVMVMLQHKPPLHP